MVKRRITCELAHTCTKIDELRRARVAVSDRRALLLPFHTHHGWSSLGSAATNVPPDTYSNVTLRHFPPIRCARIEVPVSADAGVSSVGSDGRLGAWAGIDINGSLWRPWVGLNRSGQVTRLW